MFCVRLVIDNSFEISSKERIKQFGLLKAAGASKKQVAALVLWEAVYLAVPGVIMGLLLGAACAYGVFVAVSGMSAGSGFTMSEILVYEVRPYVYVTSAVIGIVWVCVSAVATGLRSINATPVEAIRMTGKKEKITVPRRPSKIGRGGSFIGAYSSLSVKRNKKRYIITMISMVLSIVLFTSFSYGLELAKESVENDFEVIRAPADYTVDHYSLSPTEAVYRAQEMTDSGLFDWAQADSYISLYASVDDFGIGEDSRLYDEGSLVMNLHPVNKDTFEKFIETDVTYEDIDEGGAVIICSDMYSGGSKFEFTVYDTPPAPITAQPFIADTLDFLDPVTATPIGLYTTENRTYRSNNNVLTAVIGEENYLALLEVCGRDNRTYTIETDSGSYYAFNRDILANAASGREEEALLWLDRHFYGSYADNRSEKADALAVLSAVSALGYFVIGIIALIAAVNIVNIISANVLGRTTELAMLRACGMSDRQLKGLIMRESALYAAAAAVVSLILVEGAIGIIHIPFLTHFHDLDFEDLSFKLSFIAPLKYLVIAAAAAFVTAAAASLAPAGRIVKTSIVENLESGG
ncbi:MAG: FtsX-like permease family protein, partial [Ruminococcus sp.]|nr:FtsX-like permease family protein [Ruminococcus sp.]